MPRRKIDVWGDWVPRWYQLHALQAFWSGKYKRFMFIWPRRNGKDWTSWRILIEAALRKKGNYMYYFPTGVLGRKVIFEGIDNTGRGYLDSIPRELLRSVRSIDMSLTLVNGSNIYVQGTDRVDVAGPNPQGVVFSEFSQQSPMAWTYTSPILANNGGWAIFASTPRGRNHMYRLWDKTEGVKGWYRSKLSVAITGYPPMNEIRNELMAGTPPQYALQEYFCSWDAGLADAALQNEIREMRTQGRFSSQVVPREGVPIFASWDLGIDDFTSVWVGQYVDRDTIFIFGHYRARGKGVLENVLELDKKYPGISLYLLPWDGGHRDRWDGVSVKEKLMNSGKLVRMVPKSANSADDLDIVREVFPSIYMNDYDCAEGLASLEMYDPNKHEQRNDAHRKTPSHDYAALNIMCRATKMSLLTAGVDRIIQEDHANDGSWGGRIKPVEPVGRCARHHALKRIRPGRYARAG